MSRSMRNPGPPTNSRPTASAVAACRSNRPQIEVILDHDGDHVVDHVSPVTTFVRIGLWDRAYDGAGNINNSSAEAGNFVGADTRRFYFRVTDPSASGNHVTIRWKTLKADRTDDDAPAMQNLTLVRSPTGTGVFVSRAVMLVTDDTDRNQPTDTGLAAPLETGPKGHGASNHRTRRARIDGFVKATYSPTSCRPVSVRVPVFLRSPDERRRLKVRVIRYRNSARSDNATQNYIAGQFRHANRRWNQIGLKIQALKTVTRRLPTAARDAHGQYPGGANSAEEQAALNDLLPSTPNNTVTVVFVSLTGSNAYATIVERTTVALGDRYFIFINTTLDLNNETLAHEFAHVLFNRGDDTTARRYFTLNTRPPTALVVGTGISLPDVRIYRRIQNMHSADPDNDPTNDNIINWARRARVSRFPAAVGFAAPTATTGNSLIEQF